MPVFLIIFFMIFLPFGVSNYNPNHEYTLKWIIELSSFSLLTFLVSVFNEFLIKKLFIKKNSAKIVLIWSIWSFIIYGFCNFLLYNFLGNWHDFNLKSGIIFIFQFGSVILFPMLGTIFLFRHQSLKNQFDIFISEQSNKIDPSQLITFAGQGQSDKIVLVTSRFLFAQSQDNYIELYYLNNDKISKHLLRSSLKDLTKTLSFGFIIRSHRSYIVNLYHVNRVKGKASEMQLSLNQLDQTIPVSKTFISNTMLQLKKYRKI